MKKKIVVCIFMILLLVVGCGERKAEPTTTEAEKKMEEVSSGEQSSTKAENYYNISVNDKILKESEYMSVSMNELLVQGNESLQSSVSQWSKKRQKELVKQAEEWEESAKEEGMTSYYMNKQLKVACANQNILSICDYEEGYAGGAHGYHVYSGTNFDAKTGEKLAIADVVKEEEAFYKKAGEYIDTYLQEEYSDGLFPDCQETIDDMWTKEDLCWFFTASGITIVFNEYEIGPYAMGIVFVSLPYEEFADELKEEYVSNQAIGLYELEKNEDISIITEQENSKLHIASDEAGHFIILDDKKVEVAEDFNSSFAYSYLLRHTDGNLYVVLSLDMASDDWVTYLYRIQDGKVEKTDEVYAAFDLSQYSFSSFTMGSPIYCLGTYSTIQDYSINEDGKFVKESELYTLSGSMEDRAVLTTKAEIMVLVDEKEVVLPVGSKLQMMETDNETKATIYLVDTKQEATLELKRAGEEGSEIYVGEKNEYDCFEELPYAG